MRLWVMYRRRLISRLDQASTIRPSSSASSQRISSCGVALLLVPGTLALPVRVKKPPCCNACGSRPLRSIPPCNTRPSSADSSFFGFERKKASICASFTG